MEGLEFRKAPGMFGAYGYSDGSKIKKQTALIIADLRTNNIPEFYKMLKVSDMRGLEKAVASTQFKLKMMSPPDLSANNARDAGESFAGKALDALVGATPEVKAFEETKEQTEQIAVSISLVKSAVKSGLVPEQFAADAKFLGDLATFVFDGSKAFGVGEKGEAYNNLVKYLGKEIYENRGQIASGIYQRLAKSFTVIQPTHDLDRAPLVPIIIENFGEDGLQNLVNDYNNATDGCTNCSVIGPK